MDYDDMYHDVDDIDELRAEKRRSKRRIHPWNPDCDCRSCTNNEEPADVGEEE
jgi:hypothetical protein